MEAQRGCITCPGPHTKLKTGATGLQASGSEKPELSWDTEPPGKAIRSGRGTERGSLGRKMRRDEMEGRPRRRLPGPWGWSVTPRPPDPAALPQTGRKLLGTCPLSTRVLLGGSRSHNYFITGHLPLSLGAVEFSRGYLMCDMTTECRQKQTQEGRCRKQNAMPQVSWKKLFW